MFSVNSSSAKNFKIANQTIEIYARTSLTVNRARLQNELHYNLIDHTYHFNFGYTLLCVDLTFKVEIGFEIFVYRVFGT